MYQFSHSHNTLLHGAERIFQHKLEVKQQSNDDKSRVKAKNDTRNHGTEISRLSSVTDEKGLRQIPEVDVSSTDCFERIFVLFDSACSYPWFSEKLTERLKLQVPPTTLTVRGIDSQYV